mgnify:CR=1 FL=1
MNRLAVFDYNRMEIHMYNVDSNVKIDDEYVSNLGFHNSECYHMFGKNIDIVKHKGILT